MTSDYVAYTIVQVLFWILFTTAFFMNYQQTEADFSKTPVETFKTVFSASLGFFSFEMFDDVTDPLLKNAGMVLLIAVVVIFQLLLGSLMVAVLANVFETFDKLGQGLYLTTILKMRDEQTYDDSYGAFISAIPPFSILLYPFLPFVMVLPRESTVMKRINRFAGQIQYICFMVFPFAALLIVSLLLIPIAYFIAIINKIKVLRMCSDTEKKGLIIDLVLFSIFGLVILALDVILGDFYYFWANSFR